jgi:hypothetical protein
VGALSDDLQLAQDTMTSATVYLRKLQHDAAVAARISHAKMVVLQVRDYVALPGWLAGGYGAGAGR